MRFMGLLIEKIAAIWYRGTLMVGTLLLNFKHWVFDGRAGGGFMRDRYADKDSYVSVKSKVHYSELGHAI
jgi:hypothetical protein